MPKRESENFSSQNREAREIDELEKEIFEKNLFNDEQKQIIAAVVDDFEKTLDDAIEKICRKGGKVDKNWVSAFRQSYVVEKVISFGNLSPEKKEILEKYFDSKIETINSSNKNFDNNMTKLEQKDQNPHPTEKFEDEKKKIFEENDKKMDELEFDPGAEEKIKEQAYYLNEHRMSGDLERQKKWAKEYGMKDEDLTGAAVDKLLKENGIAPGTPEAQKFMQEWDWMQAKKILRKQKEAKEMEALADSSKDKKDEDTLENKTPDNQGEIDRKAAEEKYAEDRERAEDARKMEFEAEKGDVSQEDLNKAINDFEAKQAQIADMRAKKAGRWASLRKVLGLKTKNLDEDPEVMELKNESDDLYRNLMSKGINFHKGTPELQNFLKQYDEFEIFRRINNQEIDKKAENAGFPENILSGMQTLTKKWSELSWKQKLAIGLGGSLMIGAGAAALGAGTFGAATLAAGYKWGFRAFGAAAAGFGQNVRLDRQTMKAMESESEARVQERLRMLEQYEDNLDQGIEEMLSKSVANHVRKDFEGRRTENEVRALKFARNTFLVSAVVGETVSHACQATGINMGTVLSKIGEKTGISLSGIKEAIYNHIPGFKVSEAHASIIPGYEHGNAIVDTSGADPNPMTATENIANNPATGAEVPKVHVATGEYGVSDAGGADPDPKSWGESSTLGKGDSMPDTSGADPNPMTATENIANNPATGAEVPKVHVATGEYGVSDAGGADSDPMSQVEQPSSKLVGYHEVQKGGGIEKSAKAIIKANPAEFGLDPNDPQLNTKAGKEAHELAKGLAKKFGMTFKELDTIARERVLEGNEIRVYKNPITGEMNLTYNGAAFDKVLSPDNVMGASQVGAEEKIVPLQGGKIVPEKEDVIPPQKSGVSPFDEQRARGSAKGIGGAESISRDPSGRHGASAEDGGRVGVEVTPDTPEQKIANENWNKAKLYGEAVQNWKAENAPKIEAMEEMANLQQFVATRGLLNGIAREAGAPSNFFERPMSSWGEIVGEKTIHSSVEGQDIGATGKLNDSIERLNRLRPILEKYNSGSDSIEDCLRKATRDPRNLVTINRSILK